MHNDLLLLSCFLHQHKILLSDDQDDHDDDNEDEDDDEDNEDDTDDQDDHDDDSTAQNFALGFQLAPQLCSNVTPTFSKTH